MGRNPDNDNKAPEGNGTNAGIPGNPTIEEYLEANPGLKDEERYVGDFDNDVQVTMCSYCRHKWAGILTEDGRTKCNAYPDGIPEEIRTQKINHRFPYPGDNGIQFEQKEKGLQMPAWHPFTAKSKRGIFT